MTKTLLIAYGNPDRQDDGVAWVILDQLSRDYGNKKPYGEESLLTFKEDVFHFVFLLQLLPELSELMAKYDQIVFIDAHTENIPEEISINNITASYQHSPFTHHMTPQTCLELTRSIYHTEPDAILASIRGYEFGFEDHLSERTASLVPFAVEKIKLLLVRHSTRLH